MPENKPRTEAMFRPTPPDLSEFGIDTTIFRQNIDPTLSSQQYFFQAIDPLSEDTATFVSLGVPLQQKVKQIKHLTLFIHQIPLELLSKPGLDYFEFTDRSVARVNLDKHGLLELSQLIRDQLQYFTD